MRLVFNINEKIKKQNLTTNIIFHKIPCRSGRAKETKSPRTWWAHPRMSPCNPSSQTNK